MTDLAGQAVAAAGVAEGAGGATTTVPAGTFELSKYVGEDGKFQQGWREGMLPPDLRGEKFFDSIVDVQGLANIAGNQARMVGKKGIIIPTEKSSEFEVMEYRKAMDIPATSNDYAYAKPEDINIEDLSPEFMKTTFDGFHKAGINRNQAKAILDMYANHLREVEKVVDAEEQREFDEAENLIRQESGDRYDTKLHLANRMISENTQDWTEEKRERLLTALNDNALKPYVMDFMSNIASKFMEHKAILTAEDTAPYDLQMQISELMHTDAYMNGNNPDHKMMVEKVKGLFEKRQALNEQISAASRSVR